MKHGRPLRFLTLVVAGWTSFRIAMLWPTLDARATLIRALAPPVVASAAARRPEQAIDPSTTSAPEKLAAAHPQTIRQPGKLPISPVLAAMIHFGPSEPIEEPQVDDDDQATLPPPLAPTPIARGTSRLSGSAWLIARGGGGQQPSAGSQLGGSQAGFRFAYALSDARRLAAVGRIATPLEGRGREAALGLEWRASSAVRFVAEQRFALESGGRDGPALGVIAGIGPKPIGANVSLETYAQAGVIARRGVEAYGDGAVRAYRPLASIGTASIDLGAGAWGGVQRGASRLDIGPSLGAGLPVADRRLRITLDWRQRIAGSARPPSGPALSLGTDF